MAEPTGGWIMDHIEWVAGGLLAGFAWLVNVIIGDHKNEMKALRQELDENYATASNDIETVRVEANNAIEGIHLRINQLDRDNQFRHLELVKLLQERYR